MKSRRKEETVWFCDSIVKPAGKCMKMTDLITADLPNQSSGTLKYNEKMKN